MITLREEIDVFEVAICMKYLVLWFLIKERIVHGSQFHKRVVEFEKKKGFIIC